MRARQSGARVSRTSGARVTLTSGARVSLTSGARVTLTSGARVSLTSGAHVSATDSDPRPATPLEECPGLVGRRQCRPITRPAVQACVPAPCVAPSPVAARDATAASPSTPSADTRAAVHARLHGGMHYTAAWLRRHALGAQPQEACAVTAPRTRRYAAYCVARGTRDQPQLYCTARVHQPCIL